MHKKLFIHSGLHKTGSTTIQFFSNKYRENLLTSGLNYPLYIDKKNQKHQSHLQLIKDIFKDEIDFNSTSSISTSHARSFLESLALKASRDRQNILLSAESISSLSKHRLLSLAQLMRSIFKEFTIIFVFFLRDQRDLAESLYKNGFRAMVKRQQNIDLFLRDRKSYFDYSQRFDDHQDISSQLDDLSFVYFNYPTRVSLLEHFFKFLSVDIGNFSTLSSPLVKNPSLDCIDCIAKDNLQLLLPDRDENLRFNKFASQNKISTAYRFIDSLSDPDLLDFLQWNYSHMSSEKINVSTRVLKPITFEALSLAQQRLSQFLG